MKISLQQFREAIIASEPDQLIAFLDHMHDVYGTERKKTLEKLKKIANTRGYGLPYDIGICAWTDIFCWQDRMYRDYAGKRISRQAKITYGIACSGCDKTYDGRYTQLASCRGHIWNRLHNFCENCFGIHMPSNRVYHEQSRVWFENRSYMEIFLMPKQEIDWDNLKFSSTDALYDSYMRHSSNYPQLSAGVSNDIQRSMNGSHSDNPLKSRAGFLYEANETLPATPHWLGVELEVIPSPTGIKTPGFFHKVSSTLNEFTIIKPDGSLPQGGFEICSVPATLKKHYELWDKFFEQASPLLHSWGTNKCGMHVHMNKAFYADSAMGKALVFVNSMENRPFIELVAGRSANNYMRLHPKKISDYRNSEARGHYEALSISQHTGKTLELRIFRGNVRKAGFFKNLEFADAIGHFVHETSLKALSSKDFLNWVSQDSIRSRYPYFIGWAVNHKLFEAKKGDTQVIKKFSVPQTAKQEYSELVPA